MKLRAIIISLTINLPLLLFNIQTIQAQSNFQDGFPPDSSFSSSSFLPPVSPYTLDEGDVIRVSVFGLEEQGGVAEVFNDGTVTFPLIGNINVRGLTLAQVDELMTELYSRFLKRPLVTVTLEEARALTVSVVGEVNSPGFYTISRGAEVRTLTGAATEATLNITRNPKVTDLIALAGGLTVLADVRQIQLKRIQNQQEITYNLNFWQLLQNGDIAQNVNLQDGDVLVVTTREDEITPLEYQQLTEATFGIKFVRPPRVTVVGEVNRPGGYTIPIRLGGEGIGGVQGVGGLPRITTALSLSGGIKELADIRNITVTRTTRDAQQRTIEVDLWEMLQSGNTDSDIILREGDIINVPRAETIDPSESRLLATATFAPDEIPVYVVGSVRNGGLTTVEPNTSLNAAIQAAGGFNQVRANKGRVELIRFNDNGTVSKRSIEVDMAAGINEENNPILKRNDVVVVNRNFLTTVGDTVGTVLRPFTDIFSVLRIFNVID